jgi:hypothetical protein
MAMATAMVADVWVFCLINNLSLRRQPKVEAT